MTESVKRLTQWFLASGCLGVLVALVLMALAKMRLVGPEILFVLWPTSVVGMADPSGVWNTILVATFEFGGNFLLYGLIGTVVTYFFRRNRP